MRENVAKLAELGLELDKKLARLEGQRNQLERETSILSNLVKDSKIEQNILVEVNETLKIIMDNMVASNILAMEEFGTYGLQAVFQPADGGTSRSFDTDIQLRIEAKTSAGKTSFDILTVSKFDGKEVIGSSINSFGGSISHLESFLFRILCIKKLGLRKILLLDEAFSGVSSEYQANTAKLLSELCKNMGLDILLVTHVKSYAQYSDNLYEISKLSDGGGATFNKISKEEMALRKETSIDS